MHHGDAGSERVADRTKVGLTTVQHELAGEIGVRARDDLHQRAFAGPVLADETMDLAGSEGEIDSPKRLDAAKGFGDAVQFKDGGAVWRQQMCLDQKMILHPL